MVIEQGPDGNVPNLIHLCAEVRGEQTAFSDIDLLVEFMPEKHTVDNFMELAFLLEELLGRKVEVVTPDALMREGNGGKRRNAARSARLVDHHQGFGRPA